MKNKYTFLSLCDAYSKVEIPIIQRDYAQGRDTIEVKKLREKFISNFLVESILRNETVELDFVYGSILTETITQEKYKIFIPLDGQQRLTTLFLLHYFIAIKENRLEEIKDTLSKFTYETRPSSKDFITRLLGVAKIKCLSDIKEEILDSVWFDESWKYDPSVAGMLNMLATLSKNKELVNFKGSLLDRLMDRDQPLISFYFTDLDEFGLTENLYIRMNARGKMLTDFENFKSEFSKIIQPHHDLLEQVKDKIEYEWVDNLWDFRKPGSFIIDKPFMAYLSFVTEMLYFRGADYRSPLGYANEFLSFKVLSDLYSKRENLEFLIFSYDFLREISLQQQPVLWEGESIAFIVNDILQNKRDTIQMFILYHAIAYNYQRKPLENLMDYLRVVRNLIANTLDNSRREWPRMINSLENLISDENIYYVLAVEKRNIVGFSLEQRREELFKAEIILDYPNNKNEIHKIEDHKYLRGHITNLLLAPYVSDELEFVSDGLDSILYDESGLSELTNLYISYNELSEKDFNEIWGNLLITGLYSQTYDSRLIFSESYRDHPAIILFAKKYNSERLQSSLDTFIKNCQKDFILFLNEQFTDFCEIRDVKQQLYLYYIINERIYGNKYYTFFKNNNFNFGWLSKENGYKSYFKNGINNCRFFEFTNPIFQVYNQQFRYNLGINCNNTLDIEIVGGNKKRNPFDLIQSWAATITELA